MSAMKVALRMMDAMRTGSTIPPTPNIRADVTAVGRLSTAGQQIVVTAVAMPWRISLGLLIFGSLASLSAIHLAAYQDRPWALTALLAVPIGAAFTVRRPSVTAGLIIVSSLLLMLGYAGIGYSDQTDLGRAALRSVLTGETPYQVHDLGTHTNPFAYGPLAMLTAQIGPALEVVSAVALLVVLAWSRAWITLGLLAGFPPFVNLALTGLNDYTPALLVVSALLLLRAHPRLGMAVLAVSAAVKPYAAAWFLPALGFAGWSWLLVGVSALLWSPMVLWLGDFLSMIRVAGGIAGFPLVRFLAPPLALAGLFARRWDVALLLGAGAFTATMLFGQWASLGYWIVLLPVIGIALEARPADRPSRPTP